MGRGLVNRLVAGAVITLPHPPSSNRYWRVWNGRAVKGKEARDYQALIKVLAHNAGMRPVEGEVAMTVTWFRARRAGDLSNRIKVLEDALNGIAYVDDKQVVEMHYYRQDDPNRKGEVDVEVRAL